jgi:hypothetical protein
MGLSKIGREKPEDLTLSATYATFLGIAATDGDWKMKVAVPARMTANGALRREILGNLDILHASTITTHLQIPTG